MKISLVSVYVDDPIKAFKFYTEVLGFVEKMYMPEAQLAIVTSAEEPEGIALLLEPNNNPIAKEYQAALYQAEIPVIVFGVDDIQAVYTRLKEFGVLFNSKPVTTQWGTQVIFDDTFGNYIQLHQV